MAELITDYEHAGTQAVDALCGLGFTDSSAPVHTIQQDVETARARFSAVQTGATEQQRLVNAALAQLQDPAHNLSILLNWVRAVLLKSYAFLNTSGPVATLPVLLIFAIVLACGLHFWPFGP